MEADYRRCVLGVLQEAQGGVAPWERRERRRAFTMRAPAVLVSRTEIPRLGWSRGSGELRQSQSGDPNNTLDSAVRNPLEAREHCFLGRWRGAEVQRQSHTALCSRSEKVCEDGKTPHIWHSHEPKGSPWDHFLGRPFFITCAVPEEVAVVQRLKPVQLSLGPD